MIAFLIIAVGWPVLAGLAALFMSACARRGRQYDEASRRHFAEKGASKGKASQNRP